MRLLEWTMQCLTIAIPFIVCQSRSPFAMRTPSFENSSVILPKGSRFGRAEHTRGSSFNFLRMNWNVFELRFGLAGDAR